MLREDVRTRGRRRTARIAIIAAAVVTCFDVSATLFAAANTQSTFFQNTDLTAASNYTATVNATTDVIFAGAYPSTPAAFTITAANLNYGTLTDVNTNAIVLRNNTGVATNSLLTLNTAFNTFAPAQTPAGSNADFIYVGGNSNLTIQGANGSTGSGVLNLAFGNTGAVDVATGGSLTISAAITGTARDILFTGGGTVNLASTTASGIAKFTMNGGVTVNSSGILNSAATNNGVGDGSAATLNVTGGTFTSNASLSFFVGNSANGLLSVSGGSFVLGTANNLGFYLGNGFAGAGGTGTGTLTLSNTGLFTTGTTTGAFVLGSAGTATGSGVVNLNGGTLATNRAITKGASTNGSSTINLNGGTLQATGTALSIANTITTNVLAGGAKVDSNGFSITLGNNFVSGIAGDGGLTKSGLGTLTISGTNTYLGNTTVNGGTLLATVINALPGYATPGRINVGSNSTIAVRTLGGGNGFSPTDINSLVGGATFADSSAALGLDTVNGDFTYGNNLTRAMGLQKLNANTLVLTGTNSYTGQTTLAGGLLAIGTAALPSASVLQFNNGGIASSDATARTIPNVVTQSGAGTFTFGSTATYTGPLTFTDTTAIGVGNSAARNLAVNVDTTLSQGFAGSGFVTAKSGTGRLTLAGNSALTGGGTMTISAGAVQVGNGGTNGSLGTLAVVDNAILDFNRSDTTTFANAISGTGTIDQLGSGTLVLSGGSTGTPNTIGQLFTPAGTVSVTGTLNTTTKLVANGSATTPGTINWSGTGTHTGSYVGAGDGGTGTLNVTAGTFTATPATAVFIGANAASTGTIAVSGGLFDLTGDKPLYIGSAFDGAGASTGTLTIAGTGLFNTGTGSAGAFRLGANVAGTAGSGTVNLSGGTLATNRNIARGTGNLATATFNFNGGTLQATGASLSIANTVTTAVAEGGGTIDPQSFAVTIPANIGHGGTAATDGGLLVKAGAGSVTLSGTLSFTGGLTFNAGGTLSGTNNSYAGPTTINAFVDARTSGSILGLSGAGNSTSINSGGTLRYRDTGNTTIPEAVTLNGGNIIVYNDPGTTTFSAPITLAADGTIQVSPQAQASTTTVLGGGILEGATASNFTFVRNGSAAAASNDVVNVTATSSYGGSTAITDALSTNTGTFSVRLSGGNDRLPTQTSVTLGGAGGGGAAAGSGRVILGDATAGSNQTIAGLSISGTGAKNAVVGGNAATASVLTLNVASGTNTYAGQLGGSTATENNLAVVKSNSGIVALTKTNTYAGGTTITGGTLRTGAASALGTGTTGIDGGILAGNFSTGGPIDVNSGGTITAGSGAALPSPTPGTTADTIGTLTAVGNEAWKAGGAYRVKFAASGAAGTGNDLLGMTTLNLSTLAAGTDPASKFTIVLLNTAANAFSPTKTYTIASTTGAVTVPGGFRADVSDLFTLDASNVGLPSDTAFSVMLASAGGSAFNVNFNYTPTPEPATAALVGLGGSVLLGRRRRRRAGAAGRSARA